MATSTKTCGVCGKNLEIHEVDEAEEVLWMSCPEYLAGNDEHASQAYSCYDLQLASKSHPCRDVLKAVFADEEVWSFDSGTAGDDDVLIGEKSDIENDILSYNDRSEWDEAWTLTKVNWV